MKSYQKYFMLLLCAVLLAGCSMKINGKTVGSSELTIEPLNLNEKESQLLSKTGVNDITFFNLNGKLAETEDLKISVDVYKNGKLVEEIVRSTHEPDKDLRDVLLSFAVSKLSEDSSSLIIQSGIPMGLASTEYPSRMMQSAFGTLVGKKVTLTKNKPLYLASWSGTTKDELVSQTGMNGELPEGLDQVELAFLYKVLWVDKEKK